VDLRKKPAISYRKIKKSKDIAGVFRKIPDFFERSKTKKGFHPLPGCPAPNGGELYNMTTTHLEEQGRVETPKVHVHTHGYEKLVFFLGILGDGKKNIEYTRDIGAI